MEPYTFADVYFLASPGSLGLCLFFYGVTPEGRRNSRALVIIRRRPVLSSSWPTLCPPSLSSHGSTGVSGLQTRCICMDSLALLLIPLLLPCVLCWSFTESLTVQTLCALSLLFTYAVPSTWNVLPPPGPRKCQLFPQEAVQRSLPVKVCTGVSASRLS